jgi:hypothetical protein
MKIQLYFGLRFCIFRLIGYKACCLHQAYISQIVGFGYVITNFKAVLTTHL